MRSESSFADRRGPMFEGSLPSPRKLPVLRMLLLRERGSSMPFMVVEGFGGRTLSSSPLQML